MQNMAENVFNRCQRDVRAEKKEVTKQILGQICSTVSGLEFTSKHSLVQIYMSFGYAGEVHFLLCFTNFQLSFGRSCQVCFVVLTCIDLHVIEVFV